METKWVSGACVLALLIIGLTHWIHRWRNPKCKGVLPPGSMGIPLIGETLQLMTPSPYLELPQFLKKRIQRYGKIFRTSIAGHPIIVSADPKFCQFIFQQDGKLFDSSYLSTFEKIVIQEASNITGIHRYLRNTILKHLGMDALKQKLLTMMEEEFRAALSTWSQQEAVEIKRASGMLALELSAKQLISYDAKQSLEKLGGEFFSLISGLMSIPLYFPGTTHYKCLQNYKKAESTVRKIVKKRLALPERAQGSPDFLDHLIGDMKTEKFLTEEFVVRTVFTFLFAATESVSTTLSFALKLLDEHPRVFQELIDEHEAIRKSREDPDSPITWDEYKSMSFTFHVINEVLRLGSGAPGLFRKTKADVEYNGYTIPAGWTVVVATSALHMDPEIYQDPQTFNPLRWKDCKSEAMLKNLMPFGWGIRQCSGAEYARMFLATFLHVLATRYRWEAVEGGEVYRSPMLNFGKGLPFKFRQKHA